MRSRRPRWEGDCHTPRCARCEAFGHDTTGCSAPCRRCGGEHATADCLQPRSYAAAAGEKPSTSPKAAAQEGDTRADDTASRDNVEEAQVGKSDNPQEEAPIKDWSTQVASTTSDDTRQSTSSSENAPPPNTPSGADPKHSKPRGVKHTSGQVAAGRGHRSHAGESPNWKAATEPPNTPQDQQPLSPISRVLKQSRDPSLRNPLNQTIGVLGQDCDMQVDKPDLKRPHHSSSSSTDELGNPRKQAATETSRTEGPPGSKPPDT
ncbi:hypothetical protein MTO96_036032 [Rhipicephalus appendiculatus]